MSVTTAGEPSGAGNHETDIVAVDTSSDDVVEVVTTAQEPVFASAEASELDIEEGAAHTHAAACADGSSSEVPVSTPGRDITKISFHKAAFTVAKAAEPVVNVGAAILGASPVVKGNRQGINEADKNADVGTLSSAWQHNLLMINAKKQIVVRFRPEMRPIPGLPMPHAMLTVLCAGTPQDATCYERMRDRILDVFAHRRVNNIFTFVAILVTIAVCGFGLLIAWTMLGLYLGVENGMTETLDKCGGHKIVDAKSVPKGDDNEYVANFCNLNQWWFNLCIKAFVVLFSYINFLPIPWRIACYAHVWHSHRNSEAGFDFYGRPTPALWFNIEKRKRRWISICLNLAYICHFLSLVGHLIFWEYIEGQSWQGGLAQNLPFAASIGFQMAAGIGQGKAESKLIKEHPEKFPPRPGKYLYAAYQKWRSGEEKGSLYTIIRKEFSNFQSVAKERTSAKALTGIVKTPVVQKKSFARIRRFSTSAKVAAEREQAQRTVEAPADAAVLAEEAAPAEGQSATDPA